MEWVLAVPGANKRAYHDKYKYKICAHHGEKEENPFPVSEILGLVSGPSEMEIWLRPSKHARIQNKPYEENKAFKSVKYGSFTVT